MRAGLAERPEDYRWCSLTYQFQTNNKDNLLSLDFGLRELGFEGAGRRLIHNRDWVHGKGGVSDKKNDMSATSETVDRFRHRYRYFIDGGVIGAKEFVRCICSQLKDILHSHQEKQPLLISGMEKVYSLKPTNGIATEKRCDSFKQYMNLLIHNFKLHGL